MAGRAFIALPDYREYSTQEMKRRPEEFHAEFAGGAQSESSPTAMFRERSLKIASWRLAQLLAAPTCSPGTLLS
jgi:hypothetical protein